MAEIGFEVGDYVQFEVRGKSIVGEVTEVRPTRKDSVKVKYEYNASRGRSISLSVNEGWRHPDLLTKVPRPDDYREPGEMIGAIAGALRRG